MRTDNQAQIYWILPAFLIYALAFGGTIVPRVNLILSLICDEYFSDRAVNDPSFQFMPVIVGGDNPQCQIPEISALVSKFTLYYNLIAGIISALTAPIIGSYSDRHGRLKMIALASVGGLMTEVVLIVVANRPDIFSVYWILLGYFIDGFCGTFTAGMAITHAYASDATSPTQRSMAFGLFHGCLFTGVGFGPIIAGYIVEATGSLLAIFYIAASAHTLFLMFLLFIVPESLSKERQYAAREKHQIAQMSLPEESESGWSNALPTKVLKSTSTMVSNQFFYALKILWPTGPGSSPVLRRNLVLLSAIDMTIFAVAMGAITVVVLYAELAFQWNTFETSVLISTVNITRVAVLFLVLPLVVRIFRPKPDPSRGTQNNGADMLDLTIVRVSILFDVVGFVGYAAATNGNMFIGAGVVAAFGAMGSPSMQSALTKHIPPERVGQLLGAQALLHSLARVTGPTIFNSIYAGTVKNFPQTVFVCLAATFGVAWVMSWFVRPHGKHTSLSDHVSDES